MRRVVIVYISLLYALSAAGTSAETVYAVVGEYEVSSADISYSTGYVPSDSEELRKIVEDIAERYAVLTIAESKGYEIPEEKINRAVALITKTRGANTLIPYSIQREYVRQELVISEYIDDYIYPRVEISEDDLFTLFSLDPYQYMKYPPQGKTALKQVFPKYRNAALNTYITLQVGRLLSVEIEAARSELNIKYYR